MMGLGEGELQKDFGGWDSVMVTSQCILVSTGISCRFPLILLLNFTLYSFHIIREGLWGPSLCHKHLLLSHNVQCFIHSRCSVLDTGSVELSPLASMLHTAPSSNLKSS